MLAGDSDDEPEWERPRREYRIRQNSLRDGPDVCAICAASPVSLAGHFALCFEDHLPRNVEDALPPRHGEELGLSVFGSLPYLPSGLIEEILFHLDPNDLGRLFQASQTWQQMEPCLLRALQKWRCRETERIVLPLREQRERRGQDCGCRLWPTSLALPTYARLPQVGAAAASLMRSQRLPSVQVEIKTLTGMTLLVRLSSREAGRGILQEATVGDLFLAHELAMGNPPTQCVLIDRDVAPGRRINHHDEPLIAYYHQLSPSPASGPPKWRLECTLHGVKKRAGEDGGDMIPRKECAAASLSSYRDTLRPSRQTTGGPWTQPVNGGAGCMCITHEHFEAAF
jgi:hypothetical protein